MVDGGADREQAAVGSSSGPSMTGICLLCGGSSDVVSGQCLPCLERLGFALHDPETGDDDTAAQEQWIGDGEFRLGEILGEGGMGVVRRAWQPRLKRWVALKILRGGHLSTREARRRFLREAELAGRLAHPNIVSIFHSGEEDGVCWLAMELVEGRPLDELGKVPPEEAAEILRKTAGAIQHAHDQGVLHRDLKPSNILLDGRGEPQVLDFGVGKRLDASQETLATRQGQLVGTLGYLSPEQAQGLPAREPADVYGLGACLYFLLTGHAPFVGPSWEAILAQIASHEVTSPRKLAPGVPAELETICLKCLRQDAGQRYATAAALEADLGRYLQGESILAKREQWWVGLGKWRRRHPTAAALLVAAFAALLMAMAGLVWFARWTGRNALRAELLTEAAQNRASLRPDKRETALAAATQAAEIRAGQDATLARLAALALPRLELRPDPEPFAPEPPLDTMGLKAKAAVMDSRGERLAIALADQPEVVILEKNTGKELHRLKHLWPVASLAWQGELLACGGTMDYLVTIWDSRSGQRLQRLGGHDGAIHAVAFRPDSQELVSLADGNFRLWHAGLGLELLRAQAPTAEFGPCRWVGPEELRVARQDGRPGLRLHFTWPALWKILSRGAEEARYENVPNTLSLSQDGSFAAAVHEDGTRLWSLRQGGELAFYPKKGAEWMTTLLIEGGRGPEIWTAGWDQRIQHAPVLQPTGNWPRPASPGSSPLHFGYSLSSQGGDKVAAFRVNQGKGEILALGPGQRQVTLPGLGVYATAISPDGRWLASGSHLEVGLKLWDLANPAAAPRVLPFDTMPLAIEFSKDGREIWVKGSRVLRKLDAATGAALAPEITFEALGLALHPRSGRVAFLKQDYVSVERPWTSSPPWRAPLPPEAGIAGNATIEFSGDGQFLFVFGLNGSLLRLDVEALGKEYY
jgi:WD40 repeat protein